MFSAMGMDADPFAELGRELMEQETPPAAQAVTHRRPGTDKPAVTGKAAKPASNAPGQILQLKITLKGAKPPIWRRVLAPDNLTLEQLHTVIQIAMGWSDGHLHRFEINGVSYGIYPIAWMGSALVLRRMSVASGNTPNYWKRSMTPSTQILMKCRSGWAVTSTPKPLTSTRSMRSCAASNDVEAPISERGSQLGAPLAY